MKGLIEGCKEGKDNIDKKIFYVSEALLLNSEKQPIKNYNEYCVLCAGVEDVGNDENEAILKTIVRFVQEHYKYPVYVHLDPNNWDVTPKGPYKFLQEVITTYDFYNFLTHLYGEEKNDGTGIITKKIPKNWASENLSELGKFANVLTLDDDVKRLLGL